MNGTDVLNLGFKNGPAIGIALKGVVSAIASEVREKDMKLTLSALKDDPKCFLTHAHFSDLANYLVSEAEKEKVYVPTSKEFKIWGEDQIDEPSKDQMRVAMELPITEGGAMMPDAHLGYGLPIGGVLACNNAIIPYAVGVDIACRMKLSIFDIPSSHIDSSKELLKKAIAKETRFGVGSTFTRSGRRQHDVMDNSLWNEFPYLSNLKDKAWEQMGTSGSGNHFVEFGVLKIKESFNGLEPGEYLSLMSHSGSRGVGAATCNKYSKIAASKLPTKYSKYTNLAWLDLDSEDGQEYWLAMNLMGDYASANHFLIHKGVSKAIGAAIIGGVENHHNFAWKEVHNGKEVFVHRKGATPASKGELGVIPGSMADSCFVVKGKGNPHSFNSASHGAGRAMSRTEAKNRFNWPQWNKILAEKGIDLISAGLDEVPGSYKSIHQVMAAQKDLVDVIAEFSPKIVKMSDGGRAED